MDLGGWHVEPKADHATAAAVLTDDPVWAAYALGDLEPPFVDYSTVAVAISNGGERGACLTVCHPAFTFMVPAGPAGAVRALLRELLLPSVTQVSIRETHLAAFGEYFVFPEGLRRMRRMALGGEIAPDASGTDATPVRLTGDDAASLETLYSRYEESSFTADHLEGGVFFGVRGADELVAVAGTHVVSRRFRLAAIGSVFTRPESRGRGYASLLTAAVARELRAMGCETIVLNVAEANTTARRIYERLGFRDHCMFLEGRAVRIGELQ